MVSVPGAGVGRVGTLNADGEMSRQADRYLVFGTAHGLARKCALLVEDAASPHAEEILVR